MLSHKRLLRMNQRYYHHLALFVIASSAMTTPLYANNLSFSQLVNEKTQLNTQTISFDENKNDLWNKYIKEVQKLSILKAEYDQRALKFQNKTMRFSLEKIGSAPKDGYPLYIALHGGGSAPSSVNDSQWEAMKSYYRKSVQNGIYVAPRGISDSWMLHSENESYPLYDKLIEGAILFDGVNPNRVYLLGFSAGGDGVYQVTPKMPARFAAANMSAGHNNGLTFDNLYNTPFLLQVGEMDSAYNRNKLTAQNYITLNNLQAKYSGGFINDAFIHYNGSHNSWRDNDSSRNAQRVITDPIKWLAGNRDTKYINSNAIDWLNNYTRTSTPTKIVWDLSVAANSRTYQTGAAVLANEGDNTTQLAKPASLLYWLDVSVADQYPSNGKLIVEAIKETNTIHIVEVSNIERFRILLNPNLLDLSQPIKITIQDNLIATVNVKDEMAIMARTLLERSDKEQIYNAQITLAYDKNTQHWDVS